MKNKVRVKLSVERRFNLIYWVESLQGSLCVPDWNKEGKEIKAYPGDTISSRGAEYLTQSSRYELTVVPRHTR